MLLCIVFFSIQANSQLWKQYSDSAKAFVGQANSDKAIEYYYKVQAELQKDSAESVTYALNNNALANVYMGLRQHAKAEPLYLESKRIREKVLGKGHSLYGSSCYNLGALNSRIGRYEKSEQFYLEAKEIFEKSSGKEGPFYAACIENLALVYTTTGQFEKSELLLTETKQIREKLLGKAHPDYAQTCDNLGNLYNNMGQYAKAEPAYLEAKNVREKALGKEHPVYAVSCYNLGLLYRMTSDYTKSEQVNLEAKQIREKVLGKEHPEYAQSCNGLAILYNVMGRYEMAEPLYLEAKQVREKVFGKDDAEYAGICSNLGILYEAMGQYQKAEALLIEARQVKEKMLGKGHYEYAVSCNNLANLYLNIGQYQKAEPVYLQAKQTFETSRGKDDPFYAPCCENLGILYLYTGRYNEAESLITEAKQLREKLLGNDHLDYGNSCMNLASVYSRMGQYKKAEGLNVEARAIIEKTLGRNHPRYAFVCNNLGTLYTSLSQFEKAKRLLAEAKQIREKLLGREHSKYTETCNDLAFLYWTTNDYEKAAAYYEEALVLQRAQIKRIFQFTSEEEKQAYLTDNKANDNRFFSFSYMDRQPDRRGFTYDVVLSRRNLILSSLQQLRNANYNTTDTSIRNKYNNWIRSRQQLSTWYAKPIAERPAFVKDLEETTNTLEKELTLLSSDFKKQQQNELGWKDIQRSLKPAEAAIEFVEFAYADGKRWTDSTYYIALVVRKDKPTPELVLLFEKKSLDSLLKRRNLATQGDASYIDSLYLATSGENNSRSGSLYNLVWRPLEKNLKGITKVYFAPTGLLHRISFAAIPVNSNEVLGDRYGLVQLTTTASVASLPVHRLSPADEVMLYGGVKYDADSVSLKQAAELYTSSSTNASLPGSLDRGDRGTTWQYLPGSQKEINEIQRLGKQKGRALKLHENVNATEESIKSFNAKNSPAVLHIATHGFFFPDPKENKKDDLLTKFETSGKVFKQSDNPLFRSGLLFAGANNAWRGKPIDGVEDGVLTAYEVSNLYLPNTKLVVLSACETGLGDIQGSEGVYGLQRSFKMANVQNLIMSLWKVPDMATEEFMTRFYQNMFAKQSIANAFYNAQAAMKNKYRNNPYNWGAWVLVR